MAVDQPPPNPDDYAYIDDLPVTGGAWEFLRRSPDYREAWTAAQSGPVEPPGGGTNTARDWGLLRFADPDHDARTTDVFWQPELLADVVRLREARQGADHSLLHLDLASWPGRHASHCDDSGLHLILTLNGVEHRVWVTDGRGPPRGAPLEAAVDISGLIGRRMEATLRFLRGTTQPAIPVGRKLRPARSLGLRHRHMLLALDARMAGATMREVAALVFGARRLRDGWTGNRPLQNQTRFLVRSAILAMGGGYRALLKPPDPFTRRPAESPKT